MVQEITIDGKKHPLRVSISAMAALQRKTGKSFQQFAKDLQKTEDVTGMEILLYEGLRSGYAARGKLSEFPFEEEGAMYLLDDCLGEFMGLLPSFFQDIAKKMPGATPPKAVKRTRGTKK